LLTQKTQKLKKIIPLLLFILVARTANAQFTFIAGFNFYNQFLESSEYGYLQTDNALNLFFLAPQLGLKYQFNAHHSIRYLKSYQLTFQRNFIDIRPTTVFDIRNLDRLNYMYSFKKRNYITSGLTYHVYKSENFGSYSGLENYAGNFGINLGYGKEYNHGYVEISNLFALEFGEMLPASLFGYWVVDLGYYIPLSKKQSIEKDNQKAEKTVFGVGLVGAVSGFDNRSTLPSSTLLQTYWGTDVHYNIQSIGLSFFWRRTTSIFLGPTVGYASSRAAAAQWNNIGLRQTFTTKKGFQFYGTASTLSGYDASQTVPEYPKQGDDDFSIRGFTLGAGVPVKNWAFELSADCYLDVPLPQIEKGFRWDRIKASVIYNLPIITK
jgi:hypothetical protein